MKNKNEEKTERRGKMFEGVRRVFRNLSISVNLTVYVIYLVYLIYSLYADVGVKAINITLIFVTAAFMIVYLVLRLSHRRTGRQLKQIKHYYKNFKLVARTVSALTALYALISAVSSVSPLAIIISTLGAAFLIIRLIVELILGFIKKQLRKLGRGISERFGKRPEGEEDAVDEEEETPKRKKKIRRRLRKGEKPEPKEDIIPTPDACLLSDIDD